MSADRTRLMQLLDRLREFETRQPAPHERAIVETSRMALCDEISRLAHALHDTSYLRPTADPTERQAC